MENLHIQNNTIKQTSWMYLRSMVAVLALTLIMSGACSKAEKKMATSAVTAEQLYELSQTDSTLFLLDVRTPAEFEEKRVPFATANIPYDELEENRELLPKDLATPIYCFCRSGRRSGIATETLSAMGYKSVINVLGGIIRWEEVGYPTTSGPFKK